MFISKIEINDLVNDVDLRNVTNLYEEMHRQSYRSQLAKHCITFIFSQGVSIILCTNIFANDELLYF